MTKTSEANALDLLGCPECRGALEPTGTGASCTRCQVSYASVGTGRGEYLDFVGTAESRLSPTRLVMQWRPMVEVYERLWRPLFPRLWGGFPHGEERRQLLEWLAPAPGQTILDLACGPGNLSRLVAAAEPDAQVVGVDYSAPMVERALRSGPGAGRVVYARADAARLPLRAGAVDAVLCAAALHLFPDRAAALAQVGAVLRPGGRLVGMVSRPGPLPLGLDSRAFLERWGIATYDEASLAAALEQAGFGAPTTRSSGWIMLFCATRAGRAGSRRGRAKPKKAAEVRA